nr:sugar phosphate isomerase/epimerase [Maliibacterium massiliense]
MHIGLSTASFFPRYLTEEALEPIAAMGVRDCEAFLSSHYEYSAAFGQLLRSRADALGLRIGSIHALSSQFEPQLFSVSERQRKDALSVFADVCRVGRIVGAGCVVLHGQMRVKKVRAPWDFDHLAACFADMDVIAQQAQLCVAWENVHWCIYDKPGFARQMRLRAPRLRFTLDIKQALQSGCAIEAYLADMGDALCNVHVCDMRGDLTTALPGQGVVDFARLKRQLADAGYDGRVIVEVYGKDYQQLAQVQASVEHLRGIFAR